MIPIKFEDRKVGTIILIYRRGLYGVEELRLGKVGVEGGDCRRVRIFKTYEVSMLENQLIWVREFKRDTVLIGTTHETFELTSEEADAILIEEI